MDIQKERQMGCEHTAVNEMAVQNIQHENKPKPKDAMGLVTQTLIKYIYYRIRLE